jgi:hypothetical protein
MYSGPLNFDLLYIDFCFEGYYSMTANLYFRRFSIFNFDSHSNDNESNAHFAD